MAEVLFRVARDFTETPGARYYTDGEYSGQQFREQILEPFFHNNQSDILVIDLDGTEGYATSFLEEAFGGIARAYGKDVFKKRIRFVSTEEPLLPKEIESYIDRV